MALVRFVLGGEADLATGDELKGTEDRLGARIDKCVPRDQRPLWRGAVGAGTAAAGTPLTVSLVPNAPAIGRLWNITQLIALGTDDHTAVANTTVSWYLSDPSNPDLSQVVFPAMAIPGEQHFSSKVIWAHYNEELFGVITGAGAGQSITLIARFGDYPDTAVQPGSL